MTAEAGHDPPRFRISAGQICYTGVSDTEAETTFPPHYQRYLRMVAEEVSTELYKGTELEEISRRAGGAANADPVKAARFSTRTGSAESVAARIEEQVAALGMDHCWSYFTPGGLPPALVRESMTRFAQGVLPRFNR